MDLTPWIVVISALTILGTVVLPVGLVWLTIVRDGPPPPQDEDKTEG